jgi:protein CpxP
MSLKRKLISGIISAFAVASFTTFAAAQNTDADKTQQDSNQKQERRERRDDGFGKGMREGRGGGGRGGMMRAFKELNLTDAQKTQIHQIMEANKPDKSSFEAMRPLMEAKRNGTLTDEQKQQFETFKAERKQKEEQIHNQILAVLTTEQRAQLEKMQAERKAKREEWKQNRKNRDDDDDKNN